MGRRDWIAVDGSDFQPLGIGYRWNYALKYNVVGRERLAQMTTLLKEEYEHYQSIREDLAKERAGKYVAIKGTEVLGFYSDYMAAARNLYPEYKQGTVFIQEIRSGRDAHVGIIHTPGIVLTK